MSDRCRHRNGWLLAGARVEWCYECGAFRLLCPAGANSCAADSVWQRPVGRGGANPWEQFDKRTEQYLRRKATR